MKTTMRNGYHKTYKAYAYDKDGKLLTSRYDSGFSTLKALYSALCSQNPSIKPIAKIHVIDCDDDKSGRYKVTQNGSLKKIG